MSKIIKHAKIFIALAIWAAISIWAGAETYAIIDKHGLSVQLEDIAIIVTGINVVMLVAYLISLRPSKQ